MIASLKRQGLYEVSIGLGKYSYKYEIDWLNDGDRNFGRIGMVVSPSLHYLNNYGFFTFYTSDPNTLPLS